MSNIKNKIKYYNSILLVIMLITVTGHFLITIMKICWEKYVYLSSNEENNSTINNFVYVLYIIFKYIIIISLYM